MLKCSEQTFRKHPLYPHACVVHTLSFFFQILPLSFLSQPVVETVLALTAPCHVSVPIEPAVMG